VRPVAEELRPGDVPLWQHAEWRERFPWLVQGTTGTGEEEPFDLGLFGDQPVGVVMARWARLRSTLSMPAAVNARQVHGAEVRRHGGPVVPGLLVMEGYDAHTTEAPGLLLSVSVADCVPVFVVDARRRAVGLAHSGWRGTVAGILDAVVRAMQVAGSVASDLHVHMGPAICGSCYEVGPEVHAAVRPDRQPPPGPTPIDLRGALAERAATHQVAPDHVSISGHCTRCGPGRFFSHRGGSAGRQMGIIGVRA
jgi:YfiH family protein